MFFSATAEDGIMQFTKAESYGLRGVIYLARTGADKIVPLSEIARAEEVPEKFLAKIFQSLTKAKIVKSHRGIRGGFSLLGDPDDITARQIIEAIQGPYSLAKCLKYPRECDKSETCPVRDILKQAESKLMAVFEEYTVGAMMRRQELPRAHKPA